MLWSIFESILLGTVYLCLIVLVFSPTLYVLWLYVIGRRVSIKANGLLKLTVTTFIINAIVAYFMAHLAFDYLLTAKMAEWQGMARTSLDKAILSQERFFSSHRRYYAVGPVRGPYKDEYGLLVEKDVILEVVPAWDSHSNSETFQAYAVHIVSRDLLHATKDGKVRQSLRDSEESTRIKAKLFNSVR
ncbi:MAG: hypothetical protein HY914_03065 [Desulfomonile tiedjei]|nr:hypothetical protein [Desulfomonile tiedjei]